MSKCIYPCCRCSVGRRQVSPMDDSDINENDFSSNSGNSEVPIMNENNDDHVHRLVLPENAKTILLNVPLEICSNSAGSEQALTNGNNMDCAASTTSSCSSMGSSNLPCSSFIATSAKPPRRPGPAPSPRSSAGTGVGMLNGEGHGNRQTNKKSRVGGGDLIDIVLASKMSKNKSRY